MRVLLRVTWVCVHGLAHGGLSPRLLGWVPPAPRHGLEAPGDAVRGEVLGLHHLQVVELCWLLVSSYSHISGVNVLPELGAEAALLHVVEVDQREEHEHHGAHQAVHSKHHCWAWFILKWFLLFSYCYELFTMLFDQHSTKHGAAESAKTVMDSLK